MFLYCECAAGISGDMMVGALLDLGADPARLKKALASLPVEGFRTEIRRANKSGLDVCDFRVLPDAEHENFDHDMHYLHGADPAFGDHSLTRTDGIGEADMLLGPGNLFDNPLEDDGLTVEETSDINSRMHEMPELEETEDVPVHVHEHRRYADILRILDEADLTDGARDLARKIFAILAEAEAKAHGISEADVAFHEVGAVDSIVDITAAAVCLDDLGIKEAVIPVLNEGRGFVRCQHGLLPVPVPAVVNIAEAHGLPLHITDVDGELVTPTGAAIAAAIRTVGKLPERFRIVRTGIGAGKRAYSRPSLLRLMLIEPEEDPGEIVKLESNIDDCSAENFGYVMERLFEAGARDVYYTPVFMKKNRPAYLLSVICAAKDAPRLEDLIFRETTTIGIRRIRTERTVMERKTTVVRTTLGEAQVKICKKDALTRVYPEYESLRAICTKNGLSYGEAYQRVLREAEEQLLS